MSGRRLAMESDSEWGDERARPSRRIPHYAQTTQSAEHSRTDATRNPRAARAAFSPAVETRAARAVSPFMLSTSASSRTAAHADPMTSFYGRSNTSVYGNSGTSAYGKSRGPKRFSVATGRDGGGRRRVRAGAGGTAGGDPRGNFGDPRSPRATLSAAEATRNARTRRRDEETLRRRLLEPAGVSGTPVMASPRKRGLGFSEFPHMHSEVDLEKQVRAEERRRHERKMAEIAGGAAPRPFAPVSAAGLPGQTRVPAKMTFGKLEYMPEPYEETERAKQARLRDVGLSAGQPVFRAGGSAKDPYLLRRGDIHAGLAAIGKLLQRDWTREFDSIIMAKSGTIVIRFGISSKSPSIIRYMNYVMRTNETVTRYGLRKDVHRWGTKEDISLCFALKPPWTSAPKYSGSGLKGAEDQALPPV